MKTIFIFLLTFCVLHVEAQITISGKVTLGAEKEDGIGVNILLKNNNAIGTITDLDGNYSIIVPNAEAILEFSYVGYVSQDIVVGNQKIINVLMEENASQLEEVVVTGYGGALAKRDFTGSISKVSGKDIENAPVQSFDRALQGRAAGVQITSANGVPGGAVQVRIRGVGSISAGTTPLYIVDGVQLNSNSSSTFTSSMNLP